MIHSNQIRKGDVNEMKFLSWNVNGFQSVLSKNFLEVLQTTNADIFSIQETKLQDNQLDFSFDGFYSYWNCAGIAGYSGTAIFTKQEPLSVQYDFEKTSKDSEGRIITLEYPKFYLINIYAPCNQRNLKRQYFALDWNAKLIEYVNNLQRSKDIVLCGDFNVAYRKIDYGNEQREFKEFTDEQRRQFQELLELGLVDTFRFQYPDYRKYSWYKNDKRNTFTGGSRLDYFLISEELKSKIIGTQIRDDIGGSDHCPISLKLRI